MPLNPKFNKVSACASFQLAVLSLCACWDRLRDLEEELGVEVEIADISQFAADDDGSPVAFAELLEVLKERESAH